MNRADLQILAATRLREANALLAANEYNGAYYLAGYAVECAFKAVICGQVQQFDFPDRDLGRNSWTHDLARLASVALLEDRLREKLQADPVFKTNWQSVKDWSETSRYNLYDRGEATALIAAVSDSPSGVLSWITQFW